MMELIQRRKLTLELRLTVEHKWYRSEEAGRDIGSDAAIMDWTEKYGADFCRSFNLKLNDIETACESRCPGKCAGYTKCPLSMTEIHKLLKEPSAEEEQPSNSSEYAGTPSS